MTVHEGAYVLQCFDNVLRKQYPEVRVTLNDMVQRLRAGIGSGIAACVLAEEWGDSRPEVLVRPKPGTAS